MRKMDIASVKMRGEFLLAPGVNPIIFNYISLFPALHAHGQIAVAVRVYRLLNFHTSLT